MRLLSFHRAYACRHSGACCSAGWIDPLPHGVCRHFDAHPGGNCAIHRASGHHAIPRACQQFPRVATLSPLGISVTLSAFCPTAASLLFDDATFDILTVDDTRSYEGMDATGVMPPLLRDGMLMDWDAVARWEALAIATLSTHRHDVERALEIIEMASEAVCETWTPANGSLADSLTRAFAEASAHADALPPGLADASGIFSAPPRQGRAKERSRLRSLNGVPEKTPDTSAAVAHYFASHAFACWAMYDGRGIRGALDWLVKVRTALDDERRSCPDLKEAFRRADLALRHAV